MVRWARACHVPQNIAGAVVFKPTQAHIFASQHFAIKLSAPGNTHTSIYSFVRLLLSPDRDALRTHRDAHLAGPRKVCVCVPLLCSPCHVRVYAQVSLDSVALSLANHNIVWSLSQHIAHPSSTLFHWSSFRDILRTLKVLFHHHLTWSTQTTLLIFAMSSRLVAYLPSSGNSWSLRVSIEWSKWESALGVLYVTVYSVSVHSSSESIFLSLYILAYVRSVLSVTSTVKRVLSSFSLKFENLQKRELRHRVIICELQLHQLTSVCQSSVYKSYKKICAPGLTKLDRAWQLSWTKCKHCVHSINRLSRLLISSIITTTNIIKDIFMLLVSPSNIRKCTPRCHNPLPSRCPHTLDKHTLCQTLVLSSSWFLRSLPLAKREKHLMIQLSFKNISCTQLNIISLHSHLKLEKQFFNYFSIHFLFFSPFSSLTDINQKWHQFVIESWNTILKLIRNITSRSPSLSLLLVTLLHTPYITCSRRVSPLSTNSIRSTQSKQVLRPY